MGKGEGGIEVCGLNSCLNFTKHFVEEENKDFTFSSRTSKYALTGCI